MALCNSEGWLARKCFRHQLCAWYIYWLPYLITKGDQFWQGIQWQRDWFPSSSGLFAWIVITEYTLCYPVEMWHSLGRFLRAFHVPLCINVCSSRYLPNLYLHFRKYIWATNITDQGCFYVMLWAHRFDVLERERKSQFSFSRTMRCYWGSADLVLVPVVCSVPCVFLIRSVQWLYQNNFVYVWLWQTELLDS